MENQKGMTASLLEELVIARGLIKEICKERGIPEPKASLLRMEKAISQSSENAVIRDNYYHGMPWVPVDKRMPDPIFPEQNLNLLLCLNNRTFVYGGFDDGKFWLDGVRIDNVTHWQYIPLTPERGGLVE